jgi:hypothetical protein
MSRAQTQCKEDLKVNKGLFSLAALSLVAAAAVPVSAQISSGSFSVQNFNQATFNLAEAYPCEVGTYGAGSGIADQRIFTGICDPQTGTLGAAPGVLCLQRRGFVLDVNCFAVIPPNQTGPCFVQAFRLTKEVPGSFKCPDVYGTPHFETQDGVPGKRFVPYRYFQFQNNVRTWWSLNFTQPGTRFILEVVSACRAAGGPSNQVGDVRIHKDTWVWRVVANVDTLLYVIELMHTGAVSTLEIPCIIGEDMYDALKNARNRLAGAITSGNLTNIGNAIFDMEALIVANCLFIEVLNPVVVFPGTPQFGETTGFQPPGNLAPSVSFAGGASAVAGIIDTIEHPCCCKLLVDLEWIALRTGVSPTNAPFALPSF